MSQGKADANLADYNTELSSFMTQATSAQQTHEQNVGVQRRQILDKARLGEQDLFQYGRGDIFDQAVEAAYRGL